MNTEKRKTIKVDAVYDLETEDWTGFVCGCLLRADGTRDLFGVRTARKDGPIWWHEQYALAQAICDVGGDVWAHNGGHFDTLWLADLLNKMGKRFQMVCAGSTIVCLKVGKTRVFDSYALTKIRLADLTAGLSVTKHDLDLPCNCGDSCGGYCAIQSGRMSPDLWQRMIDYMVFDCVSLKLSLARLIRFAEDNDLDLSSTVGGAAWKTAARWLGLPANDIAAADWKFARDAYFGGRVYVGKRRSTKGWRYDVNAMYPSALAYGEFPAGKLINPGGSWGRDAKRHWKDHKPGVYQALVTIPEMHIPPLPVRTKQGRIAYPWGTFRGRWTEPELRYAESLGAEIIVERSLVWQKLQSIYRPWAERLFEIRSKAPGGKSGPLGTFCKFMSNAPSGKLGARAEHDTIFCRPENPIRCACDGKCHAGEPRKCGCRGKCSRGCLGECGAHVPLDPKEIFWRKQTWRIDDCSRPQHAAYLTGLSRIEWHRQALAGGADGEDVVYGDTDSIKSERPRDRRVGKKLGEWADEGQYKNMIVICPKVYRSDELAPGETVFKLKARSKGIKNPDPNKIIPGPSGKTIPLDSGQKIRGPKSGFRAGQLFVRASNSRRLSWGTGDRILNRDGITTRPAHISEIELP